ncbi:uncharacterized protein LOC62_03G005017 [Vanrija pseudolonga]|uniref:HIT-type domain-containing protein n=1 Tax=Vanrija pseudolonga TaxID=143232 RepID=A0AAF1BM06_9TREE|nr:hypothetical protein LOC62_03G005017 [Vanrija pseudolonga]
MGPKAAAAKVCEVCEVQTSKYRCSACPVRYCSVACYKTHKDGACVATSAGASAPAPSLEPDSTASTSQAADPTAEAATAPAPAPEAAPPAPLRPLTSLKWPPEPDESIFTDPLKRDDPKPLRQAELERIATSAPLRELLAEPALIKVLSALDTLPTLKARHAALARVLGVDGESLARPAARALLSRDSPPPLGDLIAGVGGAASQGDDWGADGWWLGDGERVWVGPEERRLMRLWAGVVVGAIDEGEGAWGSGGLEWEV